MTKHLQLRLLHQISVSMMTHHDEHEIDAVFIDQADRLVRVRLRFRKRGSLEENHVRHREFLHLLQQKINVFAGSVGEMTHHHLKTETEIQLTSQTDDIKCG